MVDIYLSVFLHCNFNITKIKAYVEINCPGVEAWELHDKLKKICVIISADNDRNVMEYFQRVLPNIFSERSEYIWKTIFVTSDVNSGVELPEGDFTIIHLSRNFGSQAAVQAGLDYVKADAEAVITMREDDIQAAPAVIARMLELWQNDFKLVHAECGGQEGFRLIDSEVLNVLESTAEANANLRELLDWTGFPRVTIEYQGKKRGKSNNVFCGLRSLPVSLLSLPWCLAIIFTIGGLFGWIAGICTGLTLYIFILSSIVFSALGLVGEYLKRSYTQSLHRPMYIISEKVNFE